MDVEKYLNHDNIVSLSDLKIALDKLKGPLLIVLGEEEKKLSYVNHGDRVYSIDLWGKKLFINILKNIDDKIYSTNLWRTIVRGLLTEDWVTIEDFIKQVSNVNPEIYLFEVRLID